MKVCKNGAKHSAFGAFFLKLPKFVGFYYCDLQLFGAVADTVSKQHGAGCWDQF